MASTISRGGIEESAIHRELEKRGRDPSFPLDVRRRFNAHLAWWLWERGGTSTTTLADIPQSICDSAARDLSHSLNRDEMRRELIQGCLVEKGVSTIYFHRSLQEFLAADYGREPAAMPEPAKRNPFAGLKLKPAPIVERIVDPLGDAVTRFARAAADIVRLRSEGLEALPHQRVALEVAGKAVDAIRPHGARDLRAAFAKDIGLIDEAASGKVNTVIRAMTLETELRLDNGKRADRFVSDWRARARRLDALSRDGEHFKADRVRSGMIDMAKSLQRDPQLESLLRTRVKELGLGRTSGESLSHELQSWSSLSRGRGLGR